MTFEADEGSGKTSLFDGVFVDVSSGSIAADLVDIGGSRHIGGPAVARQGKMRGRCFGGVVVQERSQMVIGFTVLAGCSER